MAGMSTDGQRITRTEEPRGFRRLWRVFRQLFHEVIGTSFAILALAWLNLALRAWTRDVAPWLIGVSVGVAAIFIAFSVSSFRRARQL
jgi:glycerol uptake facilitator-like aquaporin